jgi:membrane protease subunit (stomatin/prohibitin family)
MWWLALVAEMLVLVAGLEGELVWCMQEDCNALHSERKRRRENRMSDPRLYVWGVVMRVLEAAAMVVGAALQVVAGMEY